ncbi:riboflavin synthase subunit alpha [Buchnera aphidicola (Hormaphis cornu)]|nr:riboflavin synthase subunit alpha [Buchnera aphidicola (Hormaphis cornu)]
MFSGIVAGCGEINLITKENSFLTYIVKFPLCLLKNLKIGASVANNGCCLTVTAINDKYVSFDIIKETLIHTNLKYLNIGDVINLERSLMLGDEIGGHLVSGHINGLSEIVDIIRTKKNVEVWINNTNENFKKYIFRKGFICIDGVSLTVGNISNDCFSINLIPETISRTIFKNMSINKIVNIEIDCITKTIVDTVERIKYCKK